MKVLHLFQEYLSVSESWAYNLISNMRNCQHGIGAIYYNHRPEYLPKNFEVIAHKKNLYNLYKSPQTINPIQRTLLQAKRKIVRQEFNSIHSWIRNNKPDLIHIHFGTTAAHFMPLLKKVKTPFIVSFYGYDYRKAIFLNPQLTTKYERIFKMATQVTCEEVSGIEKLEKLGCKRFKIKVCRLGVNTDEIEYKKLDFDKKVKLVQIANFVEKKGQDDIIRMLIKYKSVLHNRISMTFIGNGDTEYGGAVFKQAAHLSNSNYITFRPVIPYSQVHTALADFDIFIHPSKFTKEGDSEGGAPTILLDAQAVGLPIISTKHCDIPQYVPKENHHLLTSERDIDAMFNSLKSLLDNTELAQNASLEGRKYVERNFNIVENAKDLEMNYRLILQSRQP